MISTHLLENLWLGKVEESNAGKKHAPQQPQHSLTHMAGEEPAHWVTRKVTGPGAL